MFFHLVLALVVHHSLSCSNFLIPAGSSVDGSTILSYSADAPELFGDVVTYPAAKHKPGDMRDIYSWDYGTLLGAIPEPEETFNVVGNTNEYQLSITETTFGGLKFLSGSDGRAICDPKHGCIDYGSLIWVTLQRAKTARAAIALLDTLMQRYGYASEGESFSIADTKEVWMMEIIGKGNISKGSVWVAIRVPDGYVGAHANQARIRTFPRDRPDSVLFSSDVVSFARHVGLYSGTDEDFSFSDTFDPVTFGGARFCEARVYSFFANVAAPEEDVARYLDYVKGENLTNRMPLFVRVGRRLSVNETFWHMRNHYEGLWMDPRRDVGAGPWQAPHRLGEDIAWMSGGKRYVSERPIGTHYAGWNLVANQRPKERYSVMWFGVDDSTFSLHVPFYGATSRLPPSWSGGTCTGRNHCREASGLPGSMTKFSLDSMHWVGQLVANYAYTRYDDIAPVINERLVRLESQLFAQVREVDTTLRETLDAETAAEAATQFSYESAERMHASWRDFHGELFTTFVDGYTMELDPTVETCGCKKRVPHWSENWKNAVAGLTGDHYRWKSIDKTTEALLYDEGQLGLSLDEGMMQAPELNGHRSETIDKLSLAALGSRGRGRTTSSREPITRERAAVEALPASWPAPSSGKNYRSFPDDKPPSDNSPSNMVHVVAVFVLTNMCSVGLGFWLHSVLKAKRSTAAASTPLLVD